MRLKGGMDCCCQHGYDYGCMITMHRRWSGRQSTLTPWLYIDVTIVYNSKHNISKSLLNTASLISAGGKATAEMPGAASRNCRASKVQKGRSSVEHVLSSLNKTRPKE
jgi:hypothetical protein